VSGWEDIFSRGFARALELWKSGVTVEAVTNLPECDATAFGRGMYAATETLMGLHDLAEREACHWGFSREAAKRLVETAAKL
jgi:hypothetical protein